MLILNALRRGPLSRTEISEVTGLQASTVTYSTSRLLSSGMIVESGRVSAAGPAGRRRCVLSVNDDFGRFAGVEMLEASFRLVLCNMRGEVVFKDEIVCRSDKGGARECFLDRLGQAVDKVAGKSGGIAVLGTGFSVPAVVSDDGAAVVESWSLGLRNEGFRDYLDSLPFNCKFENDARLCALQLSGADMENIACYHVKASGLSSISVGIGLLLGGRLYRGSHGRSGEYRSSRLAGLGMPFYQQVLNSSDKENSVCQIVADMMSLSSVLDLSRIYLNSDPELETLFRSELRRVIDQGDLPEDLIHCSISEWTSAIGGAVMMMNDFFTMPQVGDIIAGNRACNLSELLGG